MPFTRGLKLRPEWGLKLHRNKHLREFAFAFREKHCYKASNLNIFNSSDIKDLIGKYPLKGQDYIRYADAFIALADFSTEDIIFEYPYRDFYYKEQIKEVEST